MAGDQGAFMVMVEPMLPAAYRLAMAMLHSNTDAEDAVQEAMFKAWRSFRSFDRTRDLKPWLFKIVANECRRQRRSPWWSVIRRADETDRPAQGAVGAAVDGGVADLRRAIQRLPHDQRLVIVLRYYLDLPFGEVAQVLTITPKAARSRTYRALERLRLSPEVLSDE